VRPLPVAARIAQFLAVLRTHPEARTAVELSQSLTAWLSYYRLLEPVRGGANPATAASLRRHFAPLATALLDQVADTFCRFFALPWLRVECTHTRLTRVFPALCVENSLRGDTAGVHAIMRALHVYLMAPGSASSASGAPDPVGGEIRIPPAALHDILACIEQYLMGLLQFFEQNREHSILRSPQGPEEP
jgi:hypothetical protein